MYFVISVVHPAQSCPGVESRTFKDFVASFSADKLKKANVRYISAYVDKACVTRMAGRDHVSTFAVEARSAKRVDKVFGPVSGEVRQVVAWERAEK